MNTNTTDIYYSMMRDTIANGGGTYARDAFRAVELPHRYVVALGEPHARKVSADLGAGAAPAIVKALRDLSDDRQAWTAHGRALGTWVDEGVVYVDVVESFSSLDHALEAAREREQLAVWDSYIEEAITV